MQLHLCGAFVHVRPCTVCKYECVFMTDKRLSVFVVCIKGSVLNQTLLFQEPAMCWVPLFKSRVEVMDQQTIIVTEMPQRTCHS